MAERVVLCGKDLVQLTSGLADRDYEAVLMTELRVIRENLIRNGKF